MEKDTYSRIVKEYYPAYVQEMDGSWRQFGFPDEPIWIFVYDDNGVQQVVRSGLLPEE